MEMTDFKPACHEDCPRIFADVVHSCLSSTPSERPTAREIVGALNDAISSLANGTAQDSALQPQPEGARAAPAVAPKEAPEAQFGGPAAQESRSECPSTIDNAGRGGHQLYPVFEEATGSVSTGPQP